MRCLSALFVLCLIPLALCAAEDYYKLLGIDRQASDRDIKRAYRTLSKKYHPDKNPGNDSAHQKFVEVSEAYGALSNSETRRIYDQYGHDGLEAHKRRGGGDGGGAQQHHDPFEMFSRFFGGGGPFGGGGGGRRQGPSMEVKIELPLRDFYRGRKTEFSVEKQAVCEECEGSGSADGEVDTCAQCGGRGIVVQKHMLAPGIVQQVQTMCGACGGKGKTIRHACKVCGGSKVVRKVATFELRVEPGMSRGARISYENEADESPDWEAGNLVVVLDEKTPELGGDDEERTDGTFFRRKGRELFWREVLSLREAWMGDWSRNITHLDGHVVTLGRGRGEVVQPNTVEVVKGEGMPVWGEEGTDKFGALLVEYVVILPDRMDKDVEEEFWDVWVKHTGTQSEGRPQPEAGRTTKEETYTEWWHHLIQRAMSVCSSSSAWAPLVLCFLGAYHLLYYAWKGYVTERDQKKDGKRPSSSSSVVVVVEEVKTREKVKRKKSKEEL